MYLSCWHFRIPTNNFKLPISLQTPRFQSTHPGKSSFKVTAFCSSWIFCVTFEFVKNHVKMLFIQTPEVLGAPSKWSSRQVPPCFSAAAALALSSSQGPSQQRAWPWDNVPHQVRLSERRGGVQSLWPREELHSPFPLPHSLRPARLGGQLLKKHGPRQVARSSQFTTPPPPKTALLPPSLLPPLKSIQGPHSFHFPGVILS